MNPHVRLLVGRLVEPSVILPYTPKKPDIICAGYLFFFAAILSATDQAIFSEPPPALYSFFANVAVDPGW